MIYNIKDLNLMYNYLNKMIKSVEDKKYFEIKNLNIHFSKLFDNNFKNNTNDVLILEMINCRNNCIGALNCLNNNYTQIEDVVFFNRFLNDAKRNLVNIQILLESIN